MVLDERAFDTIEAAACALADELAAGLREALASRGRALLAVSGGRTPRHVFGHLRAARLDWARVAITLTDERWVPPEHPESNERLVRAYLMQDGVAAATFVPLYGGEDTPEAGQAACEARLAGLPLPFDAVYLGMGQDGHFASLFPGDRAVEAREGRCVAVPAGRGRVARMSLTAPAVLNTRRVFLLFGGADKHGAYARARHDGPAADLPLRLVLRQDTAPVTVLSAP
jgi:6-phosphogluconolactonase